MTLVNGNLTIGLVNFGFRIKKKGYLTIGLNERIEMGVTIPKSLPKFILDGGMKDLTGGNNNISLSNLGFHGTAYMEIAAGYSHQLNDQWTIGGKLKFLLGNYYSDLNSKNLHIDATSSQWNLKGDMNLDIAAPVDMDYLSRYVDGKNMQQVIDGFNDKSFNRDSLMNNNNIASMLKPVGYGAAIDFGFTYKPIENLQISAAIVDLGFIYWTKASKYNCAVDTIFDGAGRIDYGDPKYKDAVSLATSRTCSTASGSPVTARKALLAWFPLV